MAERTASSVTWRETELSRNAEWEQVQDIEQQREGTPRKGVSICFFLGPEEFIEGIHSREP